MRAFLALIFFFSLSVGTFQKWLTDLKRVSSNINLNSLLDRQFSHQYRIIHEKVSDGSEWIQFKFTLHPRINDFYLIGALEISPFHVECSFVPNVAKFKREVVAPALERLKRQEQEVQHILSNIDRQAMGVREQHQSERQQKAVINNLKASNSNEDKGQYDAQIIEINKNMERLENERTTLERQYRETQQRLPTIRSQIGRLQDPMRQKEDINNIFTVKFNFVPEMNTGYVRMVGASKYLFWGKEKDLPEKGFGKLAMNHVMELYDHWIDRTREGSVDLVDMSKKYVDNAFWDPLSILSL